MTRWTMREEVDMVDYEGRRGRRVTRWTMREGWGWNGGP